MSKAKPYIGIKRLFTGTPVQQSLKVGDVGAFLKAWLAAKDTKEIKNVHGDTWTYSQDDPIATDYTNELTGKVYYHDVTTEGVKTIAFTLGSYDMDMKADLQGGEAAESAWASATESTNIIKGVCALTKDGTYIFFPYARIIGKTTMAEKNHGLGVSAVALDPETEGESDEYWVNQDAVDLPTT